MNKKIQFFVILIIFLIMGISCSYAANQTDDVSDALTTSINENDNLITKTIDSDTVKTANSEVTNYASLSSELLDNSGVNKTINMKKGTYTITNPIKMTQKAKTIVVNGNGAVIDGSNAKSFLTVTRNNNLTINNLVIKNTKNTNEAAGIVVADYAYLTLNNCTFINNVATSKGGALLNRGTTVVNNCEFNSNTAGLGGAIWATGEYNGSIVIQNSKFIKNTANYQNNNDRTGVVYLVSGKNDKIISNTFDSNIGRPIHNFKNTLTVSKNTFKNIVLNVPKETVRGAVIDNYESDITITDNIFDNIRVSANVVRGGLLYNEIGTSTFSGNKITNFKVSATQKSDSLNGGVLYNRNSTLTVSDNEFANTNNGYRVRGGAIYNNIGTLTVTSNVFKTSNTASDQIRGGAIYNDKAEKTSVLTHGGNDFNNIKNSGSLINKTIYNDGIVKEIIINKASVITVNNVNGVVGDNIQFTANVKDTKGNPVTGGTVVFKLNGKTITDKISVKNGLATATMTALKSYSNANITAVYGGTTGILSSKTTNAAKVTLALRNAKLTVTATPQVLNHYDTVLFTAKVVDSVTGKAISDNSKAVAIFKLNGKTIINSKLQPIKFPVKNGLVTFNYVIPKGMAGYYGNGSVRYYEVMACLSHPDYNAIERATSKFTVKRSNISVSDSAVVANMTSKKLTIKANVKDFKGNNVVGVTKLNVKLNGKTIQINNATTTTFNDGVINIVLDLPAVKNINDITLVIGQRCSYESARCTITDITKVN